MSKTLRTAAIIAGSVALIATGVGAAAGIGILGSTAAGTAGAATAALAADVALYASVAASTFAIGASLTAKRPPARGSLTDVVVQVDAPQPYMMGRTYSAGVLRHDVGYGGTVDDVKNPYLGKVIVYSGGGPIQEIEATQFDYQTLDYANSGGWYYGFVGAPGQLGATPESAALTPPFAGMPDWGSDYKLSGQAAVLWNMKFDKKGKKFASGIPPFGIIAKGVKVYDPRKDSTYPGGSGGHRLTDESTWEWSENPGLHALTYAYGRHQNGKKVMGVGMPVAGIDVASFITLANICDANAWKIGGTVFEGPDVNRWENLKDILAAGGAEPIFAGGLLSVRWRAPMVALETVHESDLASDDISVTAMQSFRDRINGVVPKYRSEAHHWQYVSVETVLVPEYVAEDGEEKLVERQFNLVQEVNQAAQLAAYELVDGRELGPITLTLKPQWRRYRPGECLHLTLPSIEIDHDVIILRREFNPANATVSLTCVTETAGKHAYALGQTATPPNSPTLTDPQDRDETSNLVGGAGPPGPPGPQGIPGEVLGLLRMTLTRTSASVWTYANGIIADASAANGYVKISEGLTDVTAQATYSVVAVNCTGTVNTADNVPVAGQPKGYYQVTALAGKNATLTITATYNGATASQAFSVMQIVVGYEIVGALPNTNLFEGRIVYLTTDDKLYRYDGSRWTTAVPAVDITGQVVAAQVADGAINTAKFATGIEPVTNVTSVPTVKSTNTVFNTTDGKLYRWNGSAYVASVPAADLAGQITETQIANDAITSPKIAANAVTASEIAANAVTSDKIIANAVIAGKVAAGAISTNELAAGAVNTSKLAAGAVTANELAANSVDAGKIQAGAVVAGKLAVNSVIADNIQAGNITGAKLATTDLITLTSQINDAVITTAKIGQAQIDTLRVAGGAITANTVIGTGNVGIGAGWQDAAVLTTDWIYVGDAAYSSALVSVNFTLSADIPNQFDAAALFRLYVDINDGGGWYLQRQRVLGTSVNNGNAYFNTSAALQTVVWNSPFRVHMSVSSGAYINASVARAFDVEDIICSVIGAKR